MMKNGIFECFKRVVKLKWITSLALQSCFFIACLSLSSINWAHTEKATLPEGFGCSGICSSCFTFVPPYVGCPASGSTNFAIIFTKDPWASTYGEQCSIRGPCWICPEGHVFSNEFVAGVGQPVCRDIVDTPKPPSNCTAGTNPVIIASGNKYQ